MSGSANSMSDFVKSERKWKRKWATTNKFTGKRRVNKKKKSDNLVETNSIAATYTQITNFENNINDSISFAPALQSPTSAIDLCSSQNDLDEYISASKKKIDGFNCAKNNIELDCPSIIAEVNCLNLLIKNALCPVCKDNSLQIKEVLNKRKGLVSYLQLYCDFCDEIVGQNYTSKKVSDTKPNLLDTKKICKAKPKTSSAWKKKFVTDPFITNVKMMLGMRAIGIGYRGASRFFAIMGLPRPLHIKTFQIYQKMLHKAVMETVKIHLTEIGQKIYQAEHTDNDNTSAHVAVMFDGTWQKRGHRSHNGVGVAIEINSGWVLDFEVMSNFCISCERGPKQGDASYEDWWQNHKDLCQCNTKSSSHAMEMEAALAIWGRSLNKFNLKYTTFLSDGDSKAFLAVKNAKPYGDTVITKDDCINHVSKRMGTGLRKLSKEELMRGQKLSDAIVDKLSLYYYLAISQNTGNLEEMYKNILASLLHSASTDEKSNHRLCPVPNENRKTWCKFNQAISDGQASPAHTPIITEIQAEKMKPLYKRLSDIELLKRCLKGKTQNPTESINSLIWSFCPKHKYASREVVETAVGLAVIHFNKGTSGLGDILAKLGVPMSNELEKHSVSADKRRISFMQNKGTAQERHKRRMQKSLQAQINSQQERDEPLSYYPGGLDLGFFDQ